MTNKFAHLQKLNVDATKTVEFPMYELGDDAVLLLAPATEANKPYYNQILKSSQRTAQMMRAKKGMDSAMVKQGRNEDRKLYPQHVIKGWSGVKGSKGEEVPFSPEEASDLVNQLPDYLFDNIRNFAAMPQNFSGVVDAEDAAKN